MGGCASKSGSGRRKAAYGKPSVQGAASEDSETPEYIQLPRFANSVLAVTDCGVRNELIVGLENGAVASLDWNSGKIGCENQHHKRAINDIDAMMDVCALASRDLSVSVSRLGAPEAETVLTGHTLTVSSVRLTSDASRVATGSRDGSVRVWDPEQQKTVWKGQRPRNLVTCLAWVPTASSTDASQPASRESVIIQGSEDLSLKLWDIRAGYTPQQQLQGYTYFPLGLDVSQDGQSVLTSSKGFNGVGAEVRLWDLRTLKCALDMSGHEQDVVDCCFLDSSTGGIDSRAASVSKDGSVRTWNLQAGSCLSVINQHAAGAFTSMRRFRSARDTFTAAGLSGSCFVYQLDGSGQLTLLAAAIPPEQPGGRVTSGITAVGPANLDAPAPDPDLPQDFRAAV